MSKTCSICKIEKPASEFYKDKRTKIDGLYGHCKRCHNKMSIKWQKKHPALVRIIAAKERVKNGSRRNKEIRDWYGTHPYEAQRRYRETTWGNQKIVNSKGERFRWHDYLQLLHKSAERCELCSTKNSGKNDWCVDHDHTNGKARGLLCFKCNLGLGFLERVDKGLLKRYAQMYGVEI